MTEIGDEPADAGNREIVRAAFRRWGAGEGSFFDLLTPDADWTIVGSGPSARTYHGRQECVDKTVTPLFERLSVPVTPHVRGLWADGDMVIVRWDSDAVALDGAPYRNSYVWLLRMKAGSIVEGTVFLDLPAFDALMARVEPRPGS